MTEKTDRALPFWIVIALLAVFVWPTPYRHSGRQQVGRISEVLAVSQDLNLEAILVWGALGVGGLVLAVRLIRRLSGRARKWALIALAVALLAVAVRDYRNRIEQNKEAPRMSAEEFLGPDTLPGFTRVEIPSVGEVHFPSSMSREDMEAASRLLYERSFSRLPPPPPGYHLEPPTLVFEPPVPEQSEHAKTTPKS